MGCTVGKLDSKKLKNSPIGEVDDIKIQTVLQLNEKKSRKSGKTATKRTRRHKRGDSRNRRNNNACPDVVSRHATPRRPRPSLDAKISAKYEVKGVLGKGSLGRVWRVQHRISKQPYALKTVEAPPEGREALDAELSVLRRLDHPNVIKLVEVFEADRKVYMVMELATGGSLLDRLESRGTLPEDDSRHTLRMLLSGVRHLHLLGITHRDLKPDHLLYYHPGPSSRLLVTDFSLASTRRPTGSPFMHTVCGTPQYVAPEVVARRPYTAKVDVWAAGVIAYIVLCGAFPFDAEQDAAIFKLILRGDVDMTCPVWSKVSDEAKSFVRLLLRPDPASRPSSAAALAHPWLSSSPLTYSPPAPSCSLRSSSASSSSSSVQSSLRRASGRVQPQQLEALSADPEVAAFMTTRNHV